MTSEQAARELVQNILSDSGAADKLEAFLSLHPEPYNRLCGGLGVMMGAGFEPTEDALDEITCGDQTELRSKYGATEGWPLVDQLLNDIYEKAENI